MCMEEGAVVCGVKMGVDQSVVVGVVCRSFPFLVIMLHCKH